MPRRYLFVIILVLTLTAGIFLYFKNAQADQISCGITEQCPASGAVCLGFPVGPAQACPFCDGTASCGAFGTFICATNRWPGDTGITTCGGNEECVCTPTPTPVVDCSVTNICGVVTTGTEDSNGNCLATPAPTPAPTTCSSACGVSTATCGNTCTPPSVPVNYGNSCTATSGTNTCGQSNTVTGTIQCNGVCSAYTFLTVPPNPVGYGTACDDGDPRTDGTTIQCSRSCGGGVFVATPTPTPEPPSLFVFLSAIDNGFGPGYTDVTLSAFVSGTAAGTINYSFWWSCSYTGDSVAIATTQCGDPDGIIGNANGNKFNNVFSTTQNSNGHTYTSGSYSPLVIVERGSLAARASATVTVDAAPTLTVSSFFATPSSGTGSINSILSASVGGTVTGTINYTFWWNCDYTGTDVSAATSACGSPDGTAGNANGNKFNNVNSTSQNSVSHTYTTGSYTSFVIVERGGLAASARGATTIVVSNSPPTISAVTLTEPDYCSSGPGGIVSWTYTDAENNPQAAYRVQVLTSPGGVLAYDSNQVDSSTKTAAIPQLQLQFNTTYYVRVMAWEVNTNANSGWVNQTICNGPGCAANDLTWRTPLHAYPRVVFSWAPPSPSGNQTIIFTDATVFSDGGGARTWRWTAPGGNPSSGTTAVFNTKYTTPGIYTITDNVTDKDRYACSLSQPVLVQENIPIWKEVGPK